MSCSLAPADLGSALCNLVATFQLRDLISIISIAIVIVTFWLKLRADANAARYRETIGFIDRNAGRLQGSWNELQQHVRDQSPQAAFSSSAKDMLNLLDTTALLIKKKAFDSELIYNHWWQYFIEPMENDSIKKWVAGHQRKDKAILEHYTELQGKWKERVDRERAQGH